MQFLSINVLIRNFLTSCTHFEPKRSSWGGTLYVVLQQSSRTHCGKSATYLIAEYHRGRLQITPLEKLCTDASA